MSETDLSISVTEFKARSLRLLDDLASGRLTRIHVLKRGKPLAVISPAAKAGIRFEDAFGSMRSTTIISPDVDLLKPATDGDWEAELLREWAELHE